MDVCRLASRLLPVVCILTAVPGAARYSSQTRLYEKATQTSGKQSKFRLPAHVIPRHYEVKLQPQIYEGPQEDFSFKGSVTIFVTCLEATDVIVLHKDHLDIAHSNISVKKEGSQADLYSGYVYDEPTHFLHLHLIDTLEVQHKYVVEIRNFSGHLSTNSEGLFLSYYTEGKTRVYLVASQLEAMYARKAFPCFDEPQLKATFDVILVRRTDTGRNYVSLSNAPLSNSTVIEGSSWVEDKFETTPKMSVYTLAFVVCDFPSEERYTSTSPSVRFRTFAPPNEMQRAKKAHEAAIKVFECISGYFEPKYSTALTKLDNVFVSHFKFGAMENWGLIVYTTSTVLPGHDNAVREIDARALLTHEIAHQWFGNFVTPKWWKWAWLSEGFAYWWDQYITEQVFPDWKMTQWLVYKIHNAMLNNAVNSMSHPVEIEPKNTNDIWTTFHYSRSMKGAALVRMMQFIMGDHTFLDSLNVYLTKYKYDNTDSADLFSVLDKTLKDEDEAKFGDHFMSTKMAPWFSQPGMPVVEVHKTISGYKLMQKRYLTGNGVQELWDIPITYATMEDMRMNKTRDDIRWLNKTGSPLVIDTAPAPNSWILVNIDQVAYCRVLYDIYSWNALIGQLNSDPSAISAINRGWIINDAWTFFKDGQQKLSPALQSLGFLKSEHELLPWLSFHKHIPHLEMILETSDLHGRFVNYTKELVERPVKDLSLDIPDDMPATDILVRQILATSACKYGVDACVAEARRVFNAWKSTGTFQSHRTLRSLFFCTAVANGDHSDWKHVLTQYTSDDISEENKPPFDTLGCSKDDNKLEEFLDGCIDELHGLPRSKTPDCVKAAVLGSKVGRHEALQFLLRRSSDLLESFADAEDIGHMVDMATEHFYNRHFLEYLLPQLRDAFREANIDSVLSSVRTRAETNWAWWNKRELYTWLTK